MHGDFAKSFPSPSLAPASAGDSKVTVTCDCELIVALNAIKYLPHPGQIGIGVSKRLCSLCQKYLEKQSGNQIIV